MNELVKRLSEPDRPVVANRAEKTTTSLKERIDMNYVHILFEETGTEIGIALDKDNCNLNEADFEKGKGTVHLEGALTLNYEKVICVADIDLETLKGKGYLKQAFESDYSRIIAVAEL